MNFIIIFPIAYKPISTPSLWFSPSLSTRKTTTGNSLARAVFNPCGRSKVTRAPLYGSRSPASILFTQFPQRTSQDVMIMRIKLAKFVAFFIVFVNIVVVYFTLKLFLSFNPAGVVNPPGGAVIKVKQSVAKPALKHFHNVVSVVLREFELHENDVTQTVKSFITNFPNIQVYIICDYSPYPPLELTFWNATIKNVKIINLAPNLRYAFIEQYPLVYIKTKYVLFVPDSTRLPNRQTLQLLLTELTKQPEVVAIASPVGYKTLLSCLKVNASSRTWTLKYEIAPQGELCDAIGGKHVVLVETDVLKRLPNAFLLPFPQALYLQTAALGLKVSWFEFGAQDTDLTHVVYLFYAVNCNVFAYH